MQQSSSVGLRSSVAEAAGRIAWRACLAAILRRKTSNQEGANLVLNTRHCGRQRTKHGGANLYVRRTYVAPELWLHTSLEPLNALD